MLNSQLFDQYKETGSIEIRNQIVEKYLYMVDILIRKYLNKGVDYDDLYQVGAMALISAAERFDPDKGYEFTSFATPTIIGEIKKYFRDKEWSMRVPRRLKEISLQIPAAKEKLQADLQRKPTVPELAEYLGYSEKDILQAMESSLAYGTYSLSQSFDESGDGGTDSVFEKYTAEEDKGYDRLEYEEIIGTVFGALSTTNKYIFKKRFIENRSQGEIAKKLGVSQMTVSRAEKNIKQKFAAELEKSI